MSFQVFSPFAACENGTWLREIKHDVSRTVVDRDSQLLDDIYVYLPFIYPDLRKKMLRNAAIGFRIQLYSFLPLSQTYFKLKSCLFAFYPNFYISFLLQFDLNCDNDWLQPIPSIAFMVGMLFGALLIGTLAVIYYNT